MQKNGKINKLLIIFGIISISIGLVLIIFKYCNQYKVEQENNKQIELFFNDEISTKNTEETSETKVDNIDKVKTESSKYIAVIEIPKISLKRGLVDMDSKLNNVNKNIEILKESTMPTEDNSNLILAGHSGNGRVSYFKNINKLENGDLIYLYYNHTVYLYQVINKYEIEKTGQAFIQKVENKKILTLITCKINTNNQIVIISELVSEELY